MPVRTLLSSTSRVAVGPGSLVMVGSKPQRSQRCGQVYCQNRFGSSGFISPVLVSRFLSFISLRAIDVVRIY